ncbi:hypothetical protein [Carboxydocella sp. ULO1]|uniref:hypothetical protein n=1 Tax=Carboxydocella sp. ULO1 TaxID=1926599 RepID=UPI0009D096E5|nr:hypothetical protein [Carboxydocella sp. ULO1]GAW27509.1 hypothetical protein ULO1_00790 [Carboxydocella sp. ULO1]
MVAYVPNKNLKELAANKLVFLADPSADEHLIANPKKDFMPGLFWKLDYILKKLLI